jgi:RNA polymerase sigma-54 factor
MDLTNIPKLFLKGNQNQQLVVTQAMQRSLFVLQLPVEELADLLEQELQDNPFLERIETTANHADERGKEPSPSYSKDRQKHKDYQDALLTYTTSLFDHLMQQARDAFVSQEELSLAETIIGNLTEKGYYTDAANTPLEKKVLAIIQTFDPPGVGAKNLQESLLIQLRLQKKQDSLGHQLIERYFDALLHNQRPYLQKKLGLSPVELTLLIKELSTLNLNPASHFQTTINPHIIPDLYLDHDGENWEVRINDEPIPSFRMRKKLPSPINPEIYKHLSSGQWLLRNILNRERTLRFIAAYLIKKREDFLLGNQRSLSPLLMKELATELNLHESTITRAIAGKYLYCPAGLLSLRSFFSHKNTSPKTLLKELIRKENKQKPLSDEALAQTITAQGFPTARRTIAKYRQELAIPSQPQRKR